MFPPTVPSSMAPVGSPHTVGRGRVGHGRVSLLKARVRSTLSEAAASELDAPTALGHVPPPTEREPSPPYEYAAHTYPYATIAMSAARPDSSRSFASSSDAASPRVGSGHRANEIIASARGTLQRNGAPTHSHVNRPHISNGPLLPRPPATPPSAFPSAPAPVLTEHLSDQALAALADAQTRASVLRAPHLATVAPAHTLGAYDAEAFARQVAVGASPRRRALAPPSLIPLPTYASSVAPVATAAPLHTLEAVLRGVPCSERLRLLVDAGGTLVVDLLNHFVSTTGSGNGHQRHWPSFASLLAHVSLARRAHAEAGAPLALSSESSRESRTVRARLSRLLSSDECTLLGSGSRRADSPLDRVDLARLFHFGGRGVEAILRELQSRGETCASVRQLEEGVAREALRSCLQILDLQPRLLLPRMHHPVDAGPSSLEAQQEDRSGLDDDNGGNVGGSVGWLSAVDWFFRGFGSSEESAEEAAMSFTLVGPTLTRTLQDLAATGASFRTPRDLRRAVRQRAHEATHARATTTTLQVRASLGIPSGQTAPPHGALQAAVDFFGRHVDDFIRAAPQEGSSIGGECEVDSAGGSMSDLASEVRLLVRDVCGGDARLLLAYGRELVRILSGGTSAAPSRQRPFFSSWSTLSRLLHAIRRLEPPLRAFFRTTPGLTLLVGLPVGTASSSSSGPPQAAAKKLRAIDLAQLASLAGEDIILPPTSVPSVCTETSRGGAAASGSGRAASSQPAGPPLLLITVLNDLAASGASFTSFGSLLSSARDAYTNAAQMRRRELLTVSAALEGCRGSVLPSAFLSASSDDLALVLEACEERLDLVHACLEEVRLARHRFDALDGLTAHLFDRRTERRAERRSVYSDLHSPTCPLFAPGSSSYTSVTHATVDRLLASVGPSAREVAVFVAGLVQGPWRGRVRDAEHILHLAETQRTLLATTRARCDAETTRVRDMLRTHLKSVAYLAPPRSDQTDETGEEDLEAFVGVRRLREFTTPHSFHTAAERQAYTHAFLERLSDASLDAFLLAAGVRLDVATRTPSTSTSSVEQLLLRLDHLVHLRHTYIDLTSTRLANDLRDAEHAVRREREEVLTWLQDNGTDAKVSPIAAADTATDPRPQVVTSLLPAHIASCLTPGDITVLLMDGGATLSLGRVLREIHGARALLQTTAAAAVNLAPPLEPFSDLTTLAAAVRTHHARCHQPLRAVMLARLVSVVLDPVVDGDSGGVRPPFVFLPDATALERLLDTCVLERALLAANDGTARLLRHTAAHEALLEEAGLLGAAASDTTTEEDGIATNEASTIYTPDALAFARLQSIFFFDLIRVLSLLGESRDVAAESLDELLGEVAAFRREESMRVRDFLDEHADEIFTMHDGASSSSSSPVALTGAAARALLATLLCNFASQAHIFESSFTRTVLARTREVRRANAAAEARLARHFAGAAAVTDTLDSSGESAARRTLAVVLLPEPKRHASLRDLIAHVETMHEEQESRVRSVRELVARTRLLRDARTFSDSDASDLLDQLSTPEVDPDHRVALVEMVLLTLTREAQSSSSLPTEENAHATGFATPTELLRAVDRCRVEEVADLRRFFVEEEEDGVATQLFSVAFLSQLVADDDLATRACERAWSASGGSPTLCRQYAAAYLSSGDSSAPPPPPPPPPPLEVVDDLIAMLEQANAAALEEEVELKSALQAHGVLLRSSDKEPDAWPHLDRMYLQQVLRLTRELGYSTGRASAEFLREMVSSRSGAAFDSPRALLVELDRRASALRDEQRRLVDEQAARDAAERAECAAQEEQERLVHAAAELAQVRAEAEALSAREAEDDHRESELVARESQREQLAHYLLSDECALFHEAAREQVRRDVLAPRPTSLSHEPHHLVDALLSSVDGDLDGCFRCMESLLVRGLRFDSGAQLLAALRAALAAFEANARDIIDTMRLEPNLLPSDVADELDAAQHGAQLLMAFDRDAQLGCDHILSLARRLLYSATAASVQAQLPFAAAATANTPTAHAAFSTFAALFDAMTTQRAHDLSQLHAWIETSEAAALFDAEVEVCTTEGELQRLMLVGDAWEAVHGALAELHTAGRQFTSLEQLAAAVRLQLATADSDE